MNSQDASAFFFFFLQWTDCLACTRKPPLRVKTRTNPLCSQAASSSQSSVCGPAQTCRCPRRPGRPAGERRCGGGQVCCSKTIQCFLKHASCVWCLPGGAPVWAESSSIPGCWCKRLRWREKASYSSYSSQLKGKYTIITKTTKSCYMCLSLGFWWCQIDRRSHEYRPCFEHKTSFRGQTCFYLKMTLM